MDDIDAPVKCAEIAKQQFPQLKIFARARAASAARRKRIAAAGVCREGALLLTSPAV